MTTFPPFLCSDPDDDIVSDYQSERVRDPVLPVLHIFDPDDDTLRSCVQIQMTTLLCSCVQIQMTTLCVTISLSAYVTLFCLYSPKLYIILVHPEKNVRRLTMNTNKFG